VAVAFTVFVTLIYPLTIWYAEGRVPPRVLAGLLLLVALTRIRSLRVGQATRWWLGGTLLLATLAVWGNAALPLKLYPVVVNAALLGVFAYSLFSPPTVVERLARMRGMEYPVEAVGYMRCVTQVWCGFFALNGSIALWTAVWGSSAVWWLYNGFIAYVLIGLLFCGEYMVRCRVMGRENG